MHFCNKNVEALSVGTGGVYLETEKCHGPFGSCKLGHEFGLEEMNLLGFVVWRMWHDRNALVHDKSKFDAQLSYSLAVHRLEELKNLGISQGE